jgi:hypothetical protein
MEGDALFVAPNSNSLFHPVLLLLDVNHISIVTAVDDSMILSESFKNPCPVNVALPLPRATVSMTTPFFWAPPHADTSAVSATVVLSAASLNE